MSLKREKKTGASLVEIVLPPSLPLFHFADSKDSAKENGWSVVFHANQELYSHLASRSTKKLVEIFKKSRNSCLVWLKSRS